MKYKCAGLSVCGNINCDHAEAHEWAVHKGCGNNLHCEILDNMKKKNPDVKTLPECIEIKENN